MSDGTTQDTKTNVAVALFEQQAQFLAEEGPDFSPFFDPRAAAGDSDYDGIVDGSDKLPNSNAFSGKLYTNFATSNVSYNMDYRWFFSSNTTYNRGLATISSLISSTIYETNHMNVTTGGTLSTTNSNAISQWMAFHGMTDVKNYKLTNSDNHISEMYIGRREVTYNGATKNIICAIVRGTNGTLKEWSSNFDIGDTTKSATDWTTSANHKGFDIASNRLNANLNSYISSYGSGKTNVLWITGHSRGAAIANLLAAKQVDAGKTVFGYTFAAPTTTTSSSVTATKYNCIFNIVNEDDFVPYLPVSQWGFKRYGITKTASVATSYAADWATLVTGLGKYNHDKYGMQDTVNKLAATAASRNACYTYPGTGGSYTLFFNAASLRDIDLQSKLGTYTSNMAGTYKYSTDAAAGSYWFQMSQQPAFLMQSLAAVMAGDMSDLTYLTLKVVPVLDGAKLAVISSKLGGLEHPHYTETYYLLATKLS